MKVLLLFHLARGRTDYFRPLYGTVKDSIKTFRRPLSSGMSISLPPRKGDPDCFEVSEVVKVDHERYSFVAYLMRKLSDEERRKYPPDRFNIISSSGIKYVKDYKQLLLEERISLFGI